DGTDGVGMPALRLRQLWAAFGLHYFCGAGVLHTHVCGIVRAAPHASERESALPRGGLSDPADHLYWDGFIRRCRTIALQTALHLAGTDCGAVGNPGVLDVVEEVATWQPK